MPSPAAIPTVIEPPPTPMETVRSGVHAVVTHDPGSFKQFFDTASQLAVSLVIAGLILAFTLWASGWAARLVRRAIGRLHRTASPDATLQGFMASLVRWLVIIVGLMAVLEQLGVRTTSILAVLGAASIAIGLALQGALSNVAAGVMILILRPYRVGDVVEINGKIGSVKRLDLFVTELADPDNLDIFMPNSKVFGEMIVNYSTPANRRMELNFSVDYDHDLNQATALLLDSAASDPRILKKPPPWAKATALGEHSITVTLRAWSRLDVYWDARFDLIQRAAEALRSAGLEHPYPHQVAVTKAAKAAVAEPPRAAPVAPTRGRRLRPDVSDTPSQGGT